MELNVTIDLEGLDFGRLLSAWRWKLPSVKQIAIISCLGDLFFVDSDDAVGRLQTDSGYLVRIADSVQQFQALLQDEEFADEFFLPGFVQELLLTGKNLAQGEVYSYITPPVMGGAYSPDNIEAKNVYTHFDITGQFHEQIKDLPDGTRITMSVKTKR
ncbi:T6SS immunity protein Tdi1 domain-containing protein [Paraflavitalea pollutisoli]|uniref:T6SS immunity protein Tdi1 domain-containing protein n=1 Tax=Paraflavitalea pollutisoli TaxID=3034143 RepID=UPI0023ED8BFA|nr:T6SS immunity protein Tdi1 domain-containing protein [Paraflavitalea sp. H1-2-19X]